MTKYTWILGVLLCTASASMAHDFPNPISPQNAKQWVEQDKAVLIDIREQDEIAQGMADVAVWYPKSSIDAGFDKFVSYLAQYSGKEIILYCRSGRRASVVIEQLAGRGIKAWNMGGYNDWLKAGYGSRLPGPGER